MAEPKPIYLHDLQLFGQECKKKFRTNPVYLGDGSGTLQIIHVDTNLILEEGLLYIQLQGLAVSGSTTEKETILNSELFLILKNNNFYNENLLYNYGNCEISGCLIQKIDETGELSFDFELPIFNGYQRYIKNCYATCISFHLVEITSPTDASEYNYQVNSDLTYSILFRESITESADDTFWQLGDKYDLSIPSIGNIKSLGDNTSFSIKNSKGIAQPYLKNTIFDSIYQSLKTSKLDHDVTYLYDYTKKDSYLNGLYTLLHTDSNLGLIKSTDSKTQILLPVPAMRTSGATTSVDHPLMYVKDGLVISVKDNSIPLATEDVIGGFLMGTNEESNDNIFVELDLIGHAYINPNLILDKLSLDVHRGDLELIPATSVATGSIYQHIGNTTSNFVKAYFYISKGTVGKTTSTGNAYYIPVNLSTYVNKYLSMYDLTEGITLNASFDVTSSRTEETGIYNGNFIITINKTQEEITFTYAELQSKFDITLKQGYENPDYASRSNWTSTFTFSTIGGKLWELIDVLPRDTGGSEGSGVTWGEIEECND